MSRSSNKDRRKIRQPRVLIFGESANDLAALSFLTHAVRPDAPMCQRVLRPTILKKTAKLDKRRAMSDEIAGIQRAMNVRVTVVSTIVHRDCDDVEPAHVGNAHELMKDLSSAGIHQPVVATPAYEIESWWMLWPAAVAAARPCWRRLTIRGNVGKIVEAKQHIRRQLRNDKVPSCPDFSESDGVKVAENILKLGIIDNPVGQSDSFASFREQLEAVVF